MTTEREVKETVAFAKLAGKEVVFTRDDGYDMIFHGFGQGEIWLRMVVERPWFPGKIRAYTFVGRGQLNRYTVSLR